MGNFNNELKDYQPIPRKLIFDKTISDRARFVFCYMSAKPDDWNFFLEPMAKEIGYSTDTLRKYINELVANGWLTKGTQSRTEKNTYGAVEYTLHAKKQERMKADTEKSRHGENGTQYNRDNNKKEIKEKKDNEYKDPFAVSDETPTHTDRVNYKEIVEKYNTQLGNRLPKVLSISDKRKASIRARVKEYGIESIDTVFNNVAHSDFLLGINDKNWQCDFDWIFKPSNYIKILEGNYRNKNGNMISSEYDNTDASIQSGKCVEWMKKYTPRLLNMQGIIDEESFDKMRKTCKKGEFKKRLEAMNTDERITKDMNIVEAFINYGDKGTTKA